MMKKGAGREGMKEKLAISVVGWLYRFQMKWAKWMGKVVGRLSPAGLRVALIVFVVFGCFVFGRMMFLGIAGKSRGVIPEPSKARIIDLPETIDSLPEGDLDANVRKLRIYLDSLRLSSEGRKVLDSIMRAEGDLLDTVFELERYYQREE